MVGASAVTPRGVDWRGIVGALSAAKGSLLEVPQAALDSDPAPPRLYAMASPAARFAVLAMKLALDDAGWSTDREQIGLFLGVGASGGSMTELNNMLSESMEGGHFSLARFGKQGLAACNPLFAFQLMNNFTLCHGAILAGLGGPNGAFFSRGAGTFEALGAAIDSIETGECDRALAGGADSGRHPVTLAELQRERVLDPQSGASEGAALIALIAENEQPSVFVNAWAVAPDANDEELLGECMTEAQRDAIDFIVLAPWGGGARATLERWACTVAPHARILDISLTLGDSLAASPAMAWTVALDALASEGAHRALVLGAGNDGAIGVALFSRRVAS